MIINLIKKLFLLLLLVSIIIAGFWIYRIHRYVQEEPFQIDNPGFIVMVTPGMKVQKLAYHLYQNGILKHPEWFLVWMRFSEDRLKIKAGEYLIKPGMTPQSMITMMVEGRVLLHNLTIVEGWTFMQMMQAIQNESTLKHTLTNLSPTEIMAKVNQAMGESLHPEGRFFPETYSFPRGMTDLAFLKRAYQLMDKQLQKAWENRDPQLILKTPYEALILASIIEKESSLPEEYAEIAGVYIRRLERRMPLQADPTVVYGAANYQGQLTMEMLKTPTSYNTYTKAGLPPTPIALPSKRAIEAAMHPRAGDTLYFVAKGDGKGHVFSRTLEEHTAAVKKYRQAQQIIEANQMDVNKIENKIEVNQKTLESSVIHERISPADASDTKKN